MNSSLLGETSGLHDFKQEQFENCNMYDYIIYRFDNLKSTSTSTLDKLSKLNFNNYIHILLFLYSLYIIIISYKLYKQHYFIHNNLNSQIETLEDEIIYQMKFTKRVVNQCDDYIYNLEKKVKKLSKEIKKINNLRRSKRLRSKPEIDYKHYNNYGRKRRKIDFYNYVEC